jgi:CAAX protease family protein
MRDKTLRGSIDKAFSSCHPMLRSIEFQMPENDSTDTPLIEAPQERPAALSTLAPAWHTIVLIVGILALSIAGRAQLAAVQRVPNRLLTYGGTSAVELIMLGWVALGLRLRRIPVRSLFGDVAGGLRGIALDLGVALVFWIGSLMILGTLGILWAGIEISIKHRHAPVHAAQPFEPSASEQQTVRTLEQLAPANGKEVACWVLLCLVAGFVEEAVFRGYLQRQFTAWAHGQIAAGVVFSALLFGAAHGYQGMRNMVLLAVFGVLFSLLAIFRRGLRAGIFAHGWHDMIAGLALAALRSHHLL